MRTHTIIALMLLFGLAMPSLAQNNEKDRVQLARDRYAQGLETIATIRQYEADDIPAINYATVVRKQNWPGAGMTNDKIEFFYTEVEDEYDPNPVDYKLMFIRRTYNMAAKEYFEEYVYDEDANPLFWYAVYGYKDGKTYTSKVELRGYYYADGTLARTICKKTDENGELKECSVKDHETEYNEQTFEDAFAAALKQFRLLKGAFDALYDVEYTY